MGEKPSQIYMRRKAVPTNQRRMVTSTFWLTTAGFSWVPALQIREMGSGSASHLPCCKYRPSGLGWSWGEATGHSGKQLGLDGWSCPRAFCDSDSTRSCLNKGRDALVDVDLRALNAANLLLVHCVARKCPAVRHEGKYGQLEKLQTQ